MRLTPLVVAAVALSAFVVGLGDQYVWSYDETRPGLVAREMVLYGHWLVPHLGGNVYPDKPPLFPWLVALLSPHGVSEWSLRLPAAAASAATVGVTYVIAARLAGNGAGLVAAAALASSPQFVHWARTGRMESLLVLWITLAFWSALVWLETGTRQHAALAGVWMGLGLLTKGPFALLPVPAVALAWFAHRSARLPARSAAVIAVGVALAVPGAWLGVCALADRTEAVSYARAVVDAFAHEIASQQPRHSSLGMATVAMGFFPWTLLLPGAAVLFARAWRPAGRLLALPLAWAAMVSLLLTVFVSPRESYFLMLYPPLAIVVGWAWSTAVGRTRRLLEAPLGLTLLGCAIVGLGAMATPLSIDLHGVSVRLDARLGATVLVLSTAAMVAAVALARTGRRAGVGVVSGAAVLSVVLLAETRVYTPAVNQSFPTRPAAEGFASAAPTDTAMLYVDRQRLPALMFYLPQRPVEVRDIADMRARIAWNGEARPTFTLLPRLEFEALQSTGCRPVRIAHRDEVNRVPYILAEFRSGPRCRPHSTRTGSLSSTERPIGARSRPG